VKTGDSPSRRPDHEIRALIERSDADGIVRLGSRPAPSVSAEAFAPGERVAIVEGPLKGFAGLYSGMSSAERLVILIDLLGRETKVMVSTSHVVAAPPPA
jgi:transcriptional antiterminator RfaH